MGPKLKKKRRRDHSESMSVLCGLIHQQHSPAEGGMVLTPIWILAQNILIIN